MGRRIDQGGPIVPTAGNVGRGRDALAASEAYAQPKASQWVEIAYPDHAQVYHGAPFRGVTAGYCYEDAIGWARIAAHPLEDLTGPGRGAGWTVPSVVLDSAMYACGLHLWARGGNVIALPRGIAELNLGRAQRRAEQHCAVLLAGSATPRPESVVTLTRLRLAHRIDRRPLPPVDVLDMRGVHHPLHPRTRMALADVRVAGTKAIVLLNRRGWSNFLSCRGCGHVWMCPNCEVALVLHRAQGSLACHHCGHRRGAPRRCEECGSVAVARHGTGTESVEQELREAFGDGLPVFRLDADAAAGKGRLAQTLARFEAAPAGVLVGTQMVAKGHDFADVALGVVLDADQTLRFPDFRAEERTFALVTQLAGRVGRGQDGGRVLVQTLAPDARSIALAARHDADGFVGQELGRRQALGYPPYGTLIRIVCASPDPADALSVATRLYALIPPADATVLGPAPLFRLRGRSRSQLVIKCRDRLATLRAVGAAVDACAGDAVRRGVSVSVDPDPQ